MTMFLFVYALRMLNWMYIKFPTKMKLHMEAVCFWSFGRLELAEFFLSTHLEQCLLTYMKIYAWNCAFYYS
jgi:hypothetical protein